MDENEDEKSKNNGDGIEPKRKDEITTSNINSESHKQDNVIRMFKIKLTS